MVKARGVEPKHLISKSRRIVTLRPPHNSTWSQSLMFALRRFSKFPVNSLMFGVNQLGLADRDVSPVQNALANLLSGYHQPPPNAW